MRPQKLALDLIDLDVQVLGSLASIHSVSVLFHSGFKSRHIVAAGLKLALRDFETDVSLVVAVPQLIKLSTAKEPLQNERPLRGKAVRTWYLTFSSVLAMNDRALS